LLLEPSIFADLTREDVSITAPVAPFVAELALLGDTIPVVAVVITATGLSMAMDVGVRTVHVVAVTCSRSKSVEF